VADGTAVDVVLDAIPYGAVIEIVDPPGAALAAHRHEAWSGVIDT